MGIHDNNNVAYFWLLFEADVNEILSIFTAFLENMNFNHLNKMFKHVF